MIVDIKKIAETRSYRVKSVDLHPTEPLLALSLFTGHVLLVNIENGNVVRRVEVSSSPIRAVRFVGRKNWLIAGGDDMCIRVYNASTMERLARFQAHNDYIRYIAVHPTLPLLLTAGDDTVVKAWNWEKDWQLVQTYRGHLSYVLSLAINPKDPTQFATASMDRTVRMWSIDSPTQNYTLMAHADRGVNFVEFYPFADKPYLLTTSDDRTIKVFDYQSKNVVATLSGHAHNVSFAIWHPELPLIISGSEDSTIKLWNSRSYKLEKTINFGMERVWCATMRPDTNLLSFGFETGTLTVRMGRDEPLVSMDQSGKIVWVRHLEAFSASVRGPAAGDGELALAKKDLGSVEVQPSTLAHSPDGRYVALVGDGEYVVYTALAWRQKHFGAAQDFCWGPDASFAILDGSSVHVKKNFKDQYSVSVKGAQHVFGGAFLGVQTQETLHFFDWEGGQAVAEIEVAATSVEWAPSGALVCLSTASSAFVLSVDNEAIDDGIAAGKTQLESAFAELVELDKEPLRSVTWVGDCMVYTTASHRLNYLVGTQTYTLSHYDRPMYLLRYLARDSAVYLADRDVKVASHALSVAVVEFQTAVLRGDAESAAETLLPAVPEHERTAVARFLESEGYKELAYKITRDANHKFELALALDRLDLAAQSISLGESAKWRQLGDKYLSAWDITSAESAFKNANDLESLLLVYSSTGNTEGLLQVAKDAESLGANNVAFDARWAAGDVQGATALLNKTGRHAEAALFALTYGVPTAESVKLWKDALTADGRANIAALVLDGPDAEDPDAAAETAEQSEQPEQPEAAVSAEAPEAPESAPEPAPESQEPESAPASGAAESEEPPAETESAKNAEN